MREVPAPDDVAVNTERETSLSVGSVLVCAILDVSDAAKTENEAFSCQA